MKSKLMTVALMAAFFVSACTPSTMPGGTSRLSPEQQLQITCDGIIATVRILANYRAAGQLSKETVKTVSDLMPSTVALCSGDVTDYETALSTLQETAFILLTVKKGVGA